jgi:hypothetical protein
MKRAMLAGLGFLVCAQLQATDRLDVEALVQGPLTEVAHWTDVPAGVREDLAKRWRGEPAAPPTSRQDAMADPGQEFQEGDAIVQGGLPIRRLVLAARAPGAWLVCYEQGGIDLSFHMVLVPFETGSVRGQPEWFVLIKPPYPTNLLSLRAAVREHRFAPTR